jgi:hypothetical protein
MSCFLKHYSAVYRILEAIGTCVANGNIRILGTIVLNAIIQFLISNRNIVIVEEEWYANDPKTFFGLCEWYRAEREDIFCFLYSKFVMAEDLRHKQKYIEILKEY